MTDEAAQKKVPVFGRWRGWYWLLILALVAQLIFFTWLTVHFK
jgi:hypothetical protein